MKVRCKICGKEYSNYLKECPECNDRYQIDPNEEYATVTDRWSDVEVKWDIRKLYEYAKANNLVISEMSDAEKDKFLFEKYKK